ncbi:Coenzyme F420 hydrogenase/dehydrogenase, beta subunit C-terminal domain [Lachnospiraceae bacterium C1.1]|nr:Coenzyme F420 hydrogenase/dehydrogenase, beta subunit C-terminal domain [Lachnospiraceae bacterium C1.1]
MNLVNEEKCTGCRACENICPKGAITMKLTTEMKTVPEINSDLCIECGLCGKTCPVLNTSEFKEPLECLAAWNNNETDRETCASGGVATALYRTILENGGVIYGCDYDDNLKPIIRRSENTEDLEKFKSSKYVQSSTEHTYSEVKKDLTEGCTVLYVGSPCQIDGLQHFLNKKYENLYTVDIICHGVPPIKYFQEYIKSLKTKEKVTSVGFRGIEDFKLSLYNGSRIFYWRYSNVDYYYEQFLRGVTYRDNCYQCRYARKERISDLTIGDFWGLDKKTLKINYSGKVSVILVNTDKGKNLIKLSEKLLYTEKRETEEAVKYNEQLNRPMPVPADREVFLRKLNKGVYKALKTTATGKKITFIRIRNRLKRF